MDSHRRPDWSQGPVWLPTFIRLSGSRVYFFMPNSADVCRRFAHTDSDHCVTGWYVELGVLESVKVTVAGNDMQSAEDPALRTMTNVVEFFKNLEARVDDGVSVQNVLYNIIIIISIIDLLLNISVLSMC